MRAVMMTGMMLRRAALVLLATGTIGACGALDVSDPTAIEEDELSDAAGVELLRGAALQALSQAAGEGAVFSGLLADEFLSDPPSWATPGTWTDEMLDRRESVRYEEAGADGGYRLWQELRRGASVALPKLRAHAPPGAAEAHVGEMYALRGYAALRLAEDFCPGFPLHDVVDLKPVVSPPLSTEQALAKALADFDSAVSAAADSARVLNFARVGRARTLVHLGRLDEAAIAVADVPTEYSYQAEYNNTFDPFQPNPVAFGVFGELSRGVADQEGGTGLDFVSAVDPRLLPDTLGMATDGATLILRAAKYREMGSPLVVASGVEARLIEAEAALAADQPQWLTILNELRQTQVSPALPDTTDPGTEAARVDLLFRERAFWLFGTGHRLGDLRRLIRTYGRQPESVFPTGPYRLGGTYGTATSIPFPAAQETPLNPAVTGCTSR